MCEKPQDRWYHSNLAIVIALACAGPFALVLVWGNPHYGRFTKIWVTILVIVVTVLLCYAAVMLILMFIEQVKALQAM